MNSSDKTETPYSIAWDKYKNSQCYEGSLYALKMKGLIQPYIDNILRNAFDEGYKYGSLKSKIKYDPIPFRNGPCYL